MTARSMRVTAVLVAITVLAVGCSADWDAAPVFGPTRGAPAVSELRRVEDCADLADGTRSTLRAAVDAMWTQRDEVGADDMAFAAGEASEGASTAPPEQMAGPLETDGEERVAADVIGTNVQERDVDEADIVKTDGNRIVSVTDGVLRVADLDDTPAIDGRLDLPGRAATELFLRGDEVVIIGSGGAMVEPMPMPRVEPGIDMPFTSGTTVTVVSVADPASPTVTASTSLEGAYVAARMIDGRIRLVIRSHPQVMDDVMMADDVAAAREAVAAIDGPELLPRMVVDDRVTALGGCTDVMVLESVGVSPTLSTITAVSIGESLDDLQPVTIQGSAETVYASTDALYVTSTGWDEHGSTTAVHRFALPADGPAEHTGSGVAPGRLLNQFSLSERGEALRVVTTVDGMPTTSARLTVLDTDGDQLDEIGHLDGLGIGEEVKSVRFLDDLGYVVTFRTTDPLYALDLSDPRAPRVLGELKIPGFSEYLHPIGGGLLLGVGRQADPVTGQDQGFKVSLFDISDPAAMVEVDQIVLPDTWSAISSDHKAFLWDAGRRQAVVPTDRSSMVLRVEDGRLRVAAEIEHAGAFGAVGPIRAFVVGDDLWTLSQIGLGRTSADAPGEVELLRF